MSKCQKCGDPLPFHRDTCQDLAGYYQKVGYLRAEGLDEAQAYHRADELMEAIAEEGERQPISTHNCGGVTMKQRDHDYLRNMPSEVSKIVRNERENGRPNPFTPAQWEILCRIERLLYYDIKEPLSQCKSLNRDVLALQDKVGIPLHKRASSPRPRKPKKDGDKPLWGGPRRLEEGRTR